MFYDFFEELCLLSGFCCKSNCTTEIMPLYVKGMTDSTKGIVFKIARMRDVETCLQEDKDYHEQQGM